ncbi:MAG: hypothetical protein KAI64_07615 [Thermoplasmata archaeon]|nr:hypothetical protein [Thermoplasmata archaeon]
MKVMIKEDGETIELEGSPSEIMDFMTLRKQKEKFTAPLKKSNKGKVSQKDIYQYILAQPDYKHSINDMSNYFLGKVFKSDGDEKKDYVRFYVAVARVQRKIAKNKGGKWESEWMSDADGKYKIFWFVRNK